jgi:alpha-1,6-mannosyltransferase
VTPAAPHLPRRLELAGLAGTLLVAAGGLGAGAVPVDRTWLGLPAGGAPALGTAAVALGVVLLLGAWWLVRPHLDGAAPRAVVRAAAAWSLPLLVAPPLFSRDVYAYAGQALAASQGLDPYSDGPGAVGGEVAANVDEVWRDTPSPYGPAFLGPASLLLRLTSEVDAAVLLLRLLAVTGLVLTAVALPVLARAGGVPVTHALWLGLASPLGLLHGVAGAHNDALMVGLVLAGAALAVRTTGPAGWAAVGALVALAGLVKAPALAALPFLLMAVATWPARLRAASAGLGGATLTAAGVTWATDLGWGWLEALDAGRARPSLFSPTTGLATLLGGGEVGEAVLLTGLGVALLLGAALLVLAPRLGAVRALGLALLALVVLSPTVLPWYALWAVVPLAATAGPPLAAGLGAACAVLCLLVQPSGRVLIRPPLYGLPLLLAAAVGLVTAQVLRRRAGTRTAVANR